MIMTCRLQNLREHPSSLLQFLLGASILVLWLIVTVQSTSSSSSPSPLVSRRCIGQALSNHNETTRQGLLEHLQRETTCSTCSTTTTTGTVGTFGWSSSNRNKSIQDQTKPGYHVTILFTQPSPNLLSLAAGLLNDQLQVTIILLQEETKGGDTLFPPNTEATEQAAWVEQQVLARIPCYQERLVAKLFRVVPLEHSSIGDEEEKCRGDTVAPLDSCTLHSAIPTFEALQSYLWDQQEKQEHQDQKPQQLQSNNVVDNNYVEQSPTPDVLVMDATFIGGLLLSEIWKIPAITISSHMALGLAVEHDADRAPPGWSFVYRAYRILRERFFSLFLTRSILHLNRIRRGMGLSPIRAPMAYFGSVVAVIVDFSRREMMWHSAVRHYVPNTSFSLAMMRKATTTTPKKSQTLRPVHVTGALLPPCIPCLEASSDSSLPDTTSSRRNIANRVKPVEQESPTSTGNHTTFTLLLMPPPNITASMTRGIIRGLAIARSSLYTYDECDWDSLSCRNDATDFNVVWLDSPTPSDIESGRGGTFSSKKLISQVLPSYVTIEPCTSLLDSVARHPTVAAVIGHCNDESQIMTNSLGVSVLCLSQSERLPPLVDDARHDHTEESGSATMTVAMLPGNDIIDSQEIAVQLLGLMRRHRRLRVNTGQSSSQTGPAEEDSTRHMTMTTASPFPVDGMSRIVSLIRRVAQANHDRRPWSSISEMQKGLSFAASFQPASDTVNTKKDDGGELSNVEHENEDTENQPYDTFTVLIAWLVLLVSVLYVALKDSLLANNYWRPRRSHHRDHVEGILTRLPDLDDAWSTLVVWYKQQPSLLPDTLSISVTSASATPDVPSGPSGGNQGHNHSTHLRRRRKR